MKRFYHSPKNFSENRANSSFFHLYKRFKKKKVTVNVPTNEQKFEKRNELSRGKNETIEAADCY